MSLAVRVDPRLGSFVVSVLPFSSLFPLMSSVLSVLMVSELGIVCY